MRNTRHGTRWTASLLLAVMVLGTIAPVAQADGHGRGNGRGNAYGHDRGGDGGEVRYRGGDGGGDRGRGGYVGSQRVGGYVVDRYRTGDGGYGGYGGGYRYRSGYAPRRVVEYRSYHRGSSAGPAIFGFLGGLAVGTVLGQSSRPAYAAPPPARDDYYYYDPYCRARFSSLDAYTDHVRRCHHPRVVRVIEIDTGSCVDTYSYHDGRWADSQPGYDDGYGDGYGNGDGYGDDRRGDDDQ